MSVGSVFFAVCSLIALLGAIGTVAARSPIRCAVALLVTIVGIAGLFLKLSAEFLAAVQLIVYAGAVVVLFVFVIMLLGPDATGMPSSDPSRSRTARTVGGVLIGVLALGAGLLWFGAEVPPTRFVRAVPGHGSVEAVGTQIFTKGLVPFELATALLIVAVIGAIAVARSRHTVKKVRRQDHETRRLFHGPIHPRDAGQPIPKEGLL